ncbi:MULTISPECIES: cbb3-type cytochrome c oxidase subunit I [Bacillaceae]|uniref:Cbb3-type cytochrome c oxidase subunit I n=1 Tax=Cytobacillus firmus TaxID=1399 RepID=A0AA46P8D9_CYTFI|nr:MULTISPECIES: cbb3-type cytochrome c oxidase subunit I [Bacillaceae]MCC3648861.1 cbb3-type cytochrome c oxidase subunit I [Cytobacillus oceanisediminis]MCS0655210.1 cbb3-type cytochrome c oxidase subunit I [Cytobacillus firmus]MCU1808135.1 cbb3-type cytochrome c oxidase subunit I [Cytobacillus firmus]URT71385.1 cbb3-type cytochrome c oxidase subunit I [Cytobacillus firmus]UYG97639.1 cbb3-type cytochrome c oxidase subunit I [Cytobacillus firmus]
METVIKQSAKTQVFKDKANKVMGISLEDGKLTKSYLSVAFLAILLGGILGLLQGLNRAGMLELPAWLNYYQVLTAHGLLLVVVLSAFFTIGYFYAGLSHTLGGLLPKVRKMAWIGFWMKIFGFVLAVIPILMNEASVMYTFYPPMAASPIFYIGLVFIVLGVWMCAFGAFINVASWRKRNPGQHIPILSFFATGVFVLLFFGSIPVAIEVFTIIPWAFGWVETINVMVARTLFWAFGHTLVNIWYLTAVSAWYVIVPKVIGGRRWNDLLTRIVVIALVIMNITGGFHHQIIDPGISEPVKYMHVFMSLAIGFPSLMTAYAMFAVFERTARRKGGKGIVGWYKKLPWGDVRFLAPFIAMAAFIPAGAGGIAQTTNQLNQVVHNTMWVVGHFHLTLGMSVVMTFFGLSYWLIPYVSKRVLTPQINKLGVIQTIIWTLGMIIMSGAMHWVGLLGSPRRTSYSTYFDNATALSWDPYLFFLAIGGTLLMIGVLMQVYAVFYLMFFAPKGNTEFPIAEVEEDEAPTPRWTERWGLWVVCMIALVGMAYVIPLVDFIVNAPPGSPPFKTW